MTKKAVYWMVAAAGIAVASASAWWLQHRTPGGTETPKSDNAAPAGGPPSVGVAQVRASRLVDDAVAVGSLRSRQSVMLRPEVPGRVVELAFADGAQVRKGQLILRLDDTLTAAELSQAQAQLSIARANHKRNEELVAQNFAAQRVLDESRAALQVAEAQVQLAQARLARMRIVAPFNGTLGIRNVNLGDFVKDGADLVNLEDTSSLYVDFRLPERYQPRIQARQAVQMQLDALPGQNFTARVQAVDPLVDANGRALLVRALVQAPPQAGLRPGMFARVTVVFAVNESALMVPEEAIVPQGGKQFVFRLEPQAEGDAPKGQAAAQAPAVSRRTEVTLGARRGAQVEVISGVKAGDTIVVAGQQRLQRDGTPVRVVDLGQP